MLSQELIPGWRSGLDPAAAGMVVRSIGRGRHQLGDAVRLELADAGPGVPQLVHIQWLIATCAGPWTLWTACRPEEVAGRESEMQALDGFGDLLVGEPLALVED